MPLFYCILTSIFSTSITNNSQAKEVTMADRNVSVKHRKVPYAERYQTAIWRETPSENNPFIEESVECFGYPLGDLVSSVSFPEMLYLLLKGELPSNCEKAFLNKLMVAFCHPGQRHEASRAAVLAGVPKTLPEHVLPIALTVFGGKRTGCGDIAATMKFYSRSKRKDPESLVSNKDSLPGFGVYYGGRDIMALRIADWLITEEFETPHLEWVKKLDEHLLHNNDEAALSKVGVAAAAFCDLGIMPKYAAGLLQCLVAPSLLAQGMENANKSPTVLPFVDDKNYELVME